MNAKRKIIFKESLVNIPFIIIASIITVCIMFKAGRNVYDIEQLAILRLSPDHSSKITNYIKKDFDHYNIKYYYGDNDSSVLYAEFSYEGRKETPESKLTLYETRDGFDPGEYSSVWFMNEHYVTFTPPNSSVESDNFEMYLADEVPLMNNLVDSYSWEGMLTSCGAAENAENAYSFLGIKLFRWDHSENDTMRENFVWGIGGNPREMYSYIKGSDGEYKKAILK